MPNEWKVEDEENPKRPMGFLDLGTSPFCEGAVQTTKISLKGSIYSTNIRIQMFVE